MGEKILPENLAEVRGLYIEERYEGWFGPEEMGDPARTFTPEELTGVLVDYERFLIREGVIEVEKPKHPSNAMGRLGSSGLLKVIPEVEKGS